MEPRGRHHHRLGLGSNLGGGVRTEVLNHDLCLLGQVRRVQSDEAGDGSSGPGRLVGRIVRDRLLDAPVRLVGRVVGKHVEDEPLLDGLTHRVEVERLVAVLDVVPRPEHLQGSGLGRGREGEERKVGLAASGANGLGERQLDRVFGHSHKAGVLGLSNGEFLLVGGSEGQTEILCRLPRLGCIARRGTEVPPAARPGMAVSRPRERRHVIHIRP
jgi:hypothetical protein